MKKNTFIGIEKTGKDCCLLLSHLDFDVIRNNLADLEENDFIHECNIWGGCGDYERTIRALQNKNVELTGRVIRLPHALVYEGEDYDMGHAYHWTFEVAVIAEMTDQHKHFPAPTFPGPRDY